MPSCDRPRGELVWVHCGEAGRPRAVFDLARRLAGLRVGTTVLVTCEDGAPHCEGPANLLFDTLPADHPDRARAFIAHWRPDVLVWSWGGLHPNLVLAAADADTYMVLADAAADGFDRRRDRWLPEVSRRLLACFHVFLARSPEAQTRLVQLGRTFADIEVTSPLRPFGQTLPAADSDLTEVSQALGGRPVWLAANVQDDEVDTVITAHRTALKTSHRLLLVMHLADPAALAAADAALHRRNLRTAIWTEGEMPDDNRQVLLTDAADEMGLWFRIAPVAFLGGSLSGGHACLDPYPAAAHGAAILHGPATGAHAEAFDRLRAAGAALGTEDGQSLAQAVIRTIAPDVAAQMAMAAWDVTTAVAHSHDRIVSLVQSHLDHKEDGLA